MTRPRLIHGDVGRPDRAVWGLIVTWAVLFVPYIARAGFVRDDLGYLTEPAKFADYWSFQAWLSSSITMTARPVSAVLHGVCYWFFGTTAWPFHLVNLALFLGSVLLAYGAVRNLLGRPLGVVVAVLAIVYPCASATLFSSIMMNSNLAGLCWAGALLAASTARPDRVSWRLVATTNVLFLMSTLSYESFIPLSAAVVLAAYARWREIPRVRRLVSSALTVAPAFAVAAIYRFWLERLIFDTSFRRAQLPQDGLVGGSVRALTKGSEVAFLDSIRLSLDALGRWGEIPFWYDTLLVLVGIGWALVIYRILPTRGERLTAGAKPAWVLVAAVVLYLLELAIFVGFEPSSAGFPSRTQGGVQFTWAFVVAAGFFWVRHVGSRVWQAMAAVGLAATVWLAGVAIVVEADAWVAADRFNVSVLDKLEATIDHSELAEATAFTLVVDVPVTFPGQFNGEPSFGEPWDIGPALALRFPGKTIRPTSTRKAARRCRPTA